jgi:hypothetical protein
MVGSQAKQLRHIQKNIGLVGKLELCRVFLLVTFPGSTDVTYNKLLNYGGFYYMIYLYFVARAVPKIHTVESKARKLKDKVVFNCSVSYENKNHNAEYNLNLSWIKDGKVLNDTKYKYKVGDYTETCQHTLVIKSFRDGGNYVCRWVLQLSGKASSITGNATTVLSSMLLHALTPSLTL